MKYIIRLKMITFHHIDHNQIISIHIEKKQWEGRGGGRRSDYTVSFISIMFSIHHTFRPKENWKEYLKSSLNN